VNPIALIVKHFAGNLHSRWTNLLTTDGEKADRDRDAEFLLTESDTRANLLAAWDNGWQAVFDTLASLQPADLDRTITIRGEPHTVQQALIRGLTHAAYHVGQILYLSRLACSRQPLAHHPSRPKPQLARTVSQVAAHSVCRQSILIEAMRQAKSRQVF
jgi:hypothetical protein